MYCLLAVAFIALTTAAPVGKPTHTLTTEQVDCASAVSNLNIQGILKNFGSDDKVPIWTAMKSAAKVQCGVLTGKVSPKGSFEVCSNKCGQLNIQGILKQFGSDDKVSIWRAMKGACYGECDAIYKQASTVTGSSVRAATTSSDDMQQIVTQSQNQTSHSVKKEYYNYPTYTYSYPTYTYDDWAQGTRSPSPPPNPPVAPGQLMWTVTSGSEFCHITSDGSCVTDGHNRYDNNEDCTFKAAAQMTITAKNFHVESYYDYLMVGSEKYTGTQGPMNKLVDADTLFRWNADNIVKGDGFEICGQLPSSPPSAPPSAPVLTGDETQCKSKVANLNIEGILKEFGPDNKKAIWAAMKESAMTQCYINANEKVYKPSGASMMVCNQKCGNLNIEGIQAQFGSVDKRAVWAAMKSACSVECDNIYTAV
jgi:hypothetical protein